jgi:hypothetical protein
MISVNLFDHYLDYKDFDKQIYVKVLNFLYHEYKMFDLIKEYKFHHDDLNMHLNLLTLIDWLNLAKKKQKDNVFEENQVF